MSTRRALVTGGAGFVGGHLLAALLDAGWEVTATALNRDASHRGDVRWVYGDLRDDAHVATALAEAAPECVVHLAAISHLPTAAADPRMAWDVNVGATVGLLNQLARAHAAEERSARVLIIGSAEQYGRPELLDVGAPIPESTPQAPRTVYAATKAAQEVAALQQWRTTGLPVLVARAFNHSGPGQESRFLLPALTARALALRDAPADVPLVLGNTSPVRDFLHVSDVVAAYIALLEHGAPGTAYNVASGTGQSVRTVAERILAKVGRTPVLREDPALIRPVDVPSLVGDPSRLQLATGWRPLHSFDDLLDDLLHAATL